MARYILIDSNSGYIWGDSADIGGKLVQGTPCEVAQALDESLGEYGRTYTELSGDPRDSRTGYRVYRADWSGADAVDIIRDGQDREMIETVERDCQFDCFVVCE